MRHFCTYFDKNYISRALVLHQSLIKYCDNFTLYVLCLDEFSYTFFSNEKFEKVRPIALEELEKSNTALIKTKQGRSRIEYFFTITPCLPNYLLKKYPSIDIINYLDADLCFYHNVQPAFDELGANSILIIPHNFSEKNRSLEKYGVFNVGYISFKNDINGRSCLQWWEDQCIKWCYDRWEDGKYADQKYLDSWNSKFEGLVISKNKGLNLAPYNVDNFNLKQENDKIFVDNDPLIFFHFHSLKKEWNIIYSLNLLDKKMYSNKLLMENIYIPYINQIKKFEKKYDLKFKNIRYKKTAFDFAKLEKTFVLNRPLIHTRFITKVLRTDKWMGPLLKLKRVLGKVFKVSSKSGN